MNIGRLLRYGWAFPTTLVGLVFVLLGVLSGGKTSVVDGVIEVHGGLVRFFLRRCTLLPGGASAMTLGHVVLGLDAEALEWSRAHERVHVRQCERWGPFFIPAYLIASVVAVMRGRSAYRGNCFEVEAYDSAGD